MHPIICKIGPFTIYSYGLMLSLAFGLALLLINRRAEKENISPDIIFNFSFSVLLWGVIGARLFYVIENMGYYLKNPIETIMMQRGGLSWFGGLFSAIIFSAVYLKKRRLPAYKILDLCAPFLALAQAVGRIGCLLNGCCFGRTLIPIQLYSSLALLFIFVILRLLQDEPHKEGVIFFAYLLLYSIKRFFIEFWRSDNEIILWGLTLFQLISIAVFSIALLRLYLIKKIN